MLPKLDGLSVIQELRRDDNHTPVLILSALGQVDDRVKGLKAGGDDYLPKPYAFTELQARVEALARPTSRGADRAETARPHFVRLAPTIGDRALLTSRGGGSSRAAIAVRTVRVSGLET